MWLLHSGIVNLCACACGFDCALFSGTLGEDVVDIGGSRTLGENVVDVDGLKLMDDRVFDSAR